MTFQEVQGKKGQSIKDVEEIGYPFWWKWIMQPKIKLQMIIYLNIKSCKFMI